MTVLNISPELQWLVGIALALLSALVLIIWRIVDAGTKSNREQIAAGITSITDRLAQHIDASEQESDDLRAAQRELQKQIGDLALRMDAIERTNMTAAKKDDVHRLELQLTKALATFDGLRHLIDINAQTAARLEEWLREQSK